MSGQPYKYYTDVTKFRTEYMETLGLRADIDALNNDANRTFKETGQMPAVSQMKDNRTTSEILSDSLKLKNDLVSTIGKISSQQFGQLVVQRIQQHPLNIDNKLLIFTAQRIDDIVENLTKIYKYGIKGDSNDAEQLINFIATMYNDKNSITAQTKNFMDRQGLRSMSTAGSVFLNLYTYLTRLNVKILNMYSQLARFDVDYNPNLGQQLNNTINTCSEIASLIKSIFEVIPHSQAEVTQLEFVLQNIELFIRGSSNKTRVTSEKRGQYSLDEGFTNDPYLEFENATTYLDFINTSLPSIPMLTSLESQLNIFYEQLRKNLEELSTHDEGDENIINSTSISVTKLQTILENLYSLLLPNTEWSEHKIINLKNVKELLFFYYKQRHQQQQPQQTEPQQQLTYNNFGNVAQELQAPQAPQGPNIEEVDEPQQQEPPFQFMGQEINEETFNQIFDANEALLNILIIIANEQEGHVTEENRQDLLELIRRMYNLYPPNVNIPGVWDTMHVDDLINIIEQIIVDVRGTLRRQPINGNGIKRKQRGRPRGCGINKPKTYKESVRAHTTLDKGIQETPRFIKFGKYLLNNHKLNNENVFSLKRPSGGNIVEIPSTKLSNNLSSVIKKMVGGSIPTYSDISKLSEPEKVYLHKISKSSNILDRFDIPTPNKDQQEKDVHEFEVLKGEIMAGNDSKELIKKFKVHIMKLSKNGTLNKQEVHEILSELLDLGF